MVSQLSSSMACPQVQPQNENKPSGMLVPNSTMCSLYSISIPSIQREYNGILVTTIVQSGPGAIMWCNLPVSPLVSILQLAGVHSRSCWCPFSTTCTASRTPLPQQLSPHSISHLHVGDPRCGRDGRAHTYTNTYLTLRGRSF